jgi:hypothetical protein
MWTWITIGAGLTVGLSALISLALGALLATIGHEIAELFEAGLWRAAVPRAGGRPTGGPTNAPEWHLANPPASRTPGRSPAR